MPRLKPAIGKPRGHFIHVAVIALTPSLAFGQELGNPEAITLRAGNTNVGKALISFIATNAAPNRLQADELGKAALSTPREIVAMLCGDVHLDYFKELINANKELVIPIDEVIGDKVGRIIWPACLYAKTLDPSRQVNQRIVNRIEITNQRAGIVPQETLRSSQFSEKSKARANPNSADDPALIDNQKNLKTVPAQQVTLPVYFIPTGISKADFLKEVQSKSGLDIDGMPSNEIKEIEDIQGEISLGAEVQSASDDLAFSCVAVTRPFDAIQIVNAYKHSREIGKASVMDIQPNTAEVFVVDNGFFGANNISGKFRENFDDSPFQSKYFRASADNSKPSIISRSLEVGEKGSVSWPLNKSNFVSVNNISGHGTHVTGLILGGPYFRPHLSDIENDSPLVKIHVLNVAKGGKTLFPGVYNNFRQVISYSDMPLIVNMSIAHDGLAANEVGDVYRQLFSENTKNLYIVAAGNRGRDVYDSEVFPANAGGPDNNNVIAVAALDGDGILAKFSNKSDLSIDIAAPGCALSSWLENTEKTTRMSGTSQAAPIVTFGAVLLRSLSSSLTASKIKARIIASGDLLKPYDATHTGVAYRVALNIPKALYWLDDYIRVSGEGAGVYLGQIRDIKPLRCINFAKNIKGKLSDMWAIKRDSETKAAWLFNGRSTKLKVQPPCEFEENDVGLVSFIATHRIGDLGPEKLDKPLYIKKPISDVMEIVQTSRNLANP